MTRLIATLSESERESHASFCFRMIELSLLAATLCGVLMTFIIQIEPRAVGAFMVTASFFATSGIGYVLSLAQFRKVHYGTRNVWIALRMKEISTYLFLFAMMIFFVVTVAIVRADLVLSILAVVPFSLVCFAYLYFRFGRMQPKEF